MKPKSLHIKPRAIIVIALFNIYFLYSPNTSAQEQDTNPHFKDYGMLNENILLNLKKAVQLKNFGSSQAIKKQALALPPDSKAKIAQKTKPERKDLTGTKLVKSRNDGVLMICKYYKPYQGRAEMAEVIATATILTTDGLCATNWHVFMGYLQPETKLHPADSLLFVVTAKGVAYPINKLLAYSKDADAALFKIDTGDDRLSPIPFGNDLDVGEAVHVISNPSGHLYYYSAGIVARNTADYKIGPMGNRMEITADYAKGSSGGPILDQKGNLVGMVSTTSQIYYRNVENLQMVIKNTIPVSSIKMMIEE